MGCFVESADTSETVSRETSRGPAVGWDWIAVSSEWVVGECPYMNHVRRTGGKLKGGLRR
jgi:hypothetical protein